jgi:hypothetical protein
MKHVYPGRVAALSVLLTLFCGVSTSLSADPVAPASASGLRSKAVTPLEQAAITTAAVKILRNIAQAKGLLNEDSADTADAIKELKLADKQIDIISESVPTRKIKDRIWIATKHLEYESTDQVLPDMAPIFTSLSEVTDYLPTEKARLHLDRARQALEQGVKPEAIAQLKAADDALVYVETDLPMKTARQLVHEAWQALERDDVKQADKALSNAEENVAFISLAFQSPLIQAKTAIAHGREAYKVGNRQATGSDLSDAAEYLRKAAESSDRVMRKAVNALVAQISRLQRQLKSDDKDFDPHITAAWHRIEALSERAAERVSTAWDRFGTYSGVKQDLIEAKLQLAYARIDHLLMHDTDAAKVDLSESDSYLSSARTKAGISLEKKLQAISLGLATLETSIGDKAKPDNGAAYYALESEMTRLIATL